MTWDRVDLYIQRSGRVGNELRLETVLKLVPGVLSDAGYTVLSADEVG
jgi:hypothetical protein